jgi:hypothetical protein
MSGKKKARSPFGEWIAQLSGWKLIFGFIAAAVAGGTAVLGTFSSLERQYGIIAAHMGWARTVEVTDSVQDLKAWQLYSDIRRIKRSIYDAGTPTTERERERFEDLQAQLTTVQAEYERIRGGKKAHK